jgi:hypothetical protein
MKKSFFGATIFFYLYSSPRFIARSALFVGAMRNHDVDEAWKLEKKTERQRIEKYKI